MRHRRRGRKLGRNPNHQRALLRNLASALILSEATDLDWPALGIDPEDPNSCKPAKVKGRIITTLPKAKEVRPLVERCITIARRALASEDAAAALAPSAERHSKDWTAWRESDQWQEWARAAAPGVAARRRLIRLLGSKTAVRILFREIAPRFAARPGGYTRVLKLAKPRLGDAGPRAILELVGAGDRDRVRSKTKPTKPSFEPESPPAAPEQSESAAETAPPAES